MLGLGRIMTDLSLRGSLRGAELWMVLDIDRRSSTVRNRLLPSPLCLTGSFALSAVSQPAASPDACLESSWLQPGTALMAVAYYLTRRTLIHRPKGFSVSCTLRLPLASSSAV